MKLLVQGTNERVINYYIRVVDSINEIEALKKIHPQRLPENPWGDDISAIPAFMAIPAADRAAILLNLINFGIQDCLDHICLNFFVSGLRPHIREEVMRQSPKILDDALEMALWAASLPVTQVDQDAAPPAEETEADLIAAIKDAEANTKGRVAVLKAKLNKFHRKNGSSTAMSSSAAPKLGNGHKKPSYPTAKNSKCRYCNKMGHFQIDCISRHRDGAPMVSANGAPYSQGSSAWGAAQASATLQYGQPGPPQGLGQVVFNQLGYYQQQPPVFQ